MPALENAVYGWFGLNQALLLYVNGIRAPFLDSLMLGLSWLSHPRMFPLYIAVMLVLAWRTPARMPLRNVVTFAVGYVVANAAIVPVMKVAFDLPRPAQVLGAGLVTVLGDPEAGQAFPSGHAAFAVLLACSLMPGATRGARIVLVTFAALACVSRISTGAHWPADVVAGAIIAAAVVTCARLALGTRSV
jgi:membrane-associated phospholipid phosphatase